ncbi:MAG TPA: hypothetical protein IAC04_03300 [Candidatus Coprenecus stercoravium]|uniref:Acyl-ACP thioesterase n=1 Tax=Candidatus Coprenecus stercoravium TaxID=2840735 RepID=A0A9D2GNY2_9BACT|nr:hypothetical protein [Candidatus Coprenecus stercoravium]
MKSLTTRYRLQTSDVDIRKRFKAFSFMSRTQELADMHASTIGFGYEDLIKDNISWVVSRMRVKYLRAPEWKEEIMLSTWHKGRYGVFSLRDFEAAAEDGTTLMQATSSWLLIDISSRRMLRPDHVLGEKSTSTALEKDAIAEHCGKLSTPDNMTLVRTRDVLFSDIDFNAHTNNAKYVEWTFDALPAEELMTRDLDEFQINFNHETVLGDKVELHLGSMSPESYFVEGRCSGRTVFQTAVKFKQ